MTRVQKHNVGAASENAIASLAHVLQLTHAKGSNPGLGLELGREGKGEKDNFAWRASPCLGQPRQGFSCSD